MIENFYFNIHFKDQTLTLLGVDNFRNFAFSYVDDISYLCDMAEIEFNQSWATTSEGSNDLINIVDRLSGNEKVELEFGFEKSTTSKMSKSIRVPMDVFRIREKPGSPQANYVSTLITFVNSKLKNFVTPTKNRSFQGKYSDIAKRVALEAGFTSNNLIIEDTEGLKTVRQTHWTDGQLLRYMSERSVGAQNRSSPYIFHINEEEFHYHSYEFPQKGEKYKLSDPLFGDGSYLPTKVEKEQQEYSTRVAIDWIGNIRNKFLLSIGGYGAATGGVVHDKGYVLKEITGKNAYSENQQLTEKTLSKIEDQQSKGRFSYTGVRDPDELDAIAKFNVSQSLQNIVELEVLLRGRLERKSNRIVQFHQTVPGSDTKKSKYDGLYYIQSVTHVIQNGEYYNLLKLVRPGLSGSESGLVKTQFIKRD